MTLAADIDLALAFIDGRLVTMSCRTLASTSEAVDLLLDLRALLAPDPNGTSHV